MAVLILKNGYINKKGKWGLAQLEEFSIWIRENGRQHNETKENQIGQYMNLKIQAVGHCPEWEILLNHSSHKGVMSERTFEKLKDAKQYIKELFKRYGFV